MASLFNMVCPICPPIQTPLCLNVSQYLKHLELFITCGIGGCLRTFKNIRTLRNHVSGFHSDRDNLDESNYTDNDESHDNSDDDFTEENDWSNAEQHDNIIDATTTLKISSALFILKLKEKQKLTQVAVQQIIEGVASLFQGHLDALLNQIKSKLVEAGVSTSTIPGFDDLFKEEEHYNPFFGLETKHKQLNFFRKHLNFVVSLVTTFVCTLEISSFRTLYVCH